MLRSDPTGTRTQQCSAIVILVGKDRHVEVALALQSSYFWIRLRPENSEGLL